MDRGDLGTLLDFNYWARDRILSAVEPLSDEQYTRDLGNSFRSVRDTLVHTASAQWLWLERWRGTAPRELWDPAAYSDVAALRLETQC